MTTTTIPTQWYEVDTDALMSPQNFQEKVNEYVSTHPHTDEDIRTGYLSFSYKCMYNEDVSDVMSHRKRDAVIKQLQSYKNTLPDDIDIDWDTMINAVKNAQKHTGSVEAPVATPIQKKLCEALDTYALLVQTSLNLSGHGKSWEPVISTTSHNGHIVSVSLRSYQGGDRFSIHSSDEATVVDAVQQHVVDIAPVLLGGMTNTNPFVSALVYETQGVASDNQALQEYHRAVEGYSEHPYSNVAIYNGVFLNVIRDWEVTSSGIPDSDIESEYGIPNFPYVNDREMNYPVVIDVIMTMCAQQ